uniref:Cycloidea-like protein n=1 Tax=Panagrolaimus davidi TaxID=227884 RepID=A0A914QD28_9BILA
MVTKDVIRLFSKEKQKFPTNDNDEHLNLNLKQNRMCSDFTDVQTFSKPLSHKTSGKTKIAATSQYINFMVKSLDSSGYGDKNNIKNFLLANLFLGKGNIKKLWAAAKYTSSNPTVSEYRKEKKKLQTPNKTSDSCSISLTLINEAEEKFEKRWKKCKLSDSVNSSTLSLHISVYENSFDTVSNQNDESLKVEKLKSINASTFVVQVILKKIDFLNSV